MTTSTVQIRRKGVITLPGKIRKTYGLEEGDVLSFTDLSEGVFLLTAKPSEVARSADKVARALEDAGVTLEELLETLEEERRTYYQEHYAQVQPVLG